MCLYLCFKQEKQAKEEAERIAALRQAEIENRRIRAQASSQAQVSPRAVLVTPC